MRILCTMPGRYGDLLWSLPTVRALSEASATPVDVLCSAKYSALQALVGAQPYVARAWNAPSWEVQETAPMTPRTPPAELPALAGYDRIYHLGYETWPSPTLAEDIYYRAVRASDEPLPTLDLDRPWITCDGTTTLRAEDRPLVWVGWSEEYFELKVGLLVLLAARFPSVRFWWLRPHGWARYREADQQHTTRSRETYHRLGPNVMMLPAGWEGTARLGRAATAFLGCLSAPWVLANALGVPTVVVEPSAPRHHPVFWREAPNNHLVRGGDGQPTFDARHAGDVLAAVLQEKGY